MELKKVRLIYNPKSGLIHGPRLIRKAIEGVFAEAPFAYDFVETEYRGHAHELARQAAAEGYDAVVAIGGDGTVNEVGSALLYSETALGIVPAGSGNGLARGLSIPVAVRRAARTLLHGRIRTIEARGKSVSPQAGEFDKSATSVASSFNYLLRPALAGAQGIGGGK